MKARHPVQPAIQDEHGVHRYKPNKIVQYLQEISSLDELASMGFPDEDWEQFSQLIGYSVSGLCDLSYVTDRVANKGLRRSEKLTEHLNRLMPKDDKESVSEEKE